MKLATYKDGSRDGQLVVVSRDLTHAHYTSHIANRLQQVLDDWNYLSPQLQDVYDSLNAGRARHAFPFDPQQCLAPLPRAYQRLEGTAYAASELQMVQAVSDDLSGPCDAIRCLTETAGVDFGAEIVVVTGDVPAGCPADRALDGIRLLMLANHTHNSTSATAFSPVAVTLDELGEAWAKGRVHLSLQTSWNGRKVGLCEAGVDMDFHFGQLIAHACQTRRLRAGTLMGSGVVRNRGVEKKGNTDWPKGYNCIADKRAMEAAHNGGESSTEWMKLGDTVRIDMKGRDGHSLCGAIEQDLVLTHPGRASAAAQTP